MRKYLRYVFICVLLLIVAASLYFIDGYLNQSMKHAIYVGGTEKMKLLKRIGSRVNAKDDISNTPMHIFRHA